MPSHIHPTAIIADGAEIGENVTIGAFCCIGQNVKIGNNTIIHQSVIIDGYTQIGSGNQFFPGAVIGMSPQQIRYAGEVSRLIIGDNNMIREHVSIHPGTADGDLTTRVGSNGMFMAGSHIAHDCVVDDHVILANHVQVAGHVQLGQSCYLGGMAGIVPFARIGRNAIIGGMSKVDQDVIPFGRVDGNKCYLEGINVIGLKRNGFSKERIKTILAAFKDLFKKNESFDDCIAKASQTYADNEDVKVILDFIAAGEKRAIMQAKRNGKS